MIFTIRIYESGGYIGPSGPYTSAPKSALDAQKTISYKILEAHNLSSDMKKLRLRFDTIASHDITYVGIIQTARASGLESFPIPYVLTNCHNSLCAVGGTINEDDHIFGLSAAKKYGGEFVPAHIAVIHQYMREKHAACGKMILASDSHTRYGPLGTLSVGEGGPELVKQLLNRTYDINMPQIVGVYLSGKPRPGVGPQDVALALIGKVFGAGLVKNKILEFVGPGIASLGMDYRFGIDVMTTETACLSSVWETDSVTEDYLSAHGRSEDYKALSPEEGAFYDMLIHIELDKIEPMIALPFHPSNAFTIKDFRANIQDILNQVEQEAKAITGGKVTAPSLLTKIVNGNLQVDQGIIAGCSGGLFGNICRASEIINGRAIGSDAFSLSVYPASQPLMLALMQNGVLPSLISSGATVRTAFCGPCFGAGDVPANGGFSIRHTTRNFPNREGSKPSDGQISYVALMDARSIAATALNGGMLTGADELPNPPSDGIELGFEPDLTPYNNRIYHGVGNPKPEEKLVFGPNIADWPSQVPLPENLIMTVASAIYDPVTTTDELIPSGETSSYRSNPLRLAEFTLSRKDPGYVERAKKVQRLERARRTILMGACDSTAVSMDVLSEALCGLSPENTGFGSVVAAIKPGDGSAREQAASCQRVLGGVANIAKEYATKRYCSNVINWGMIPFILPSYEDVQLSVDDRIIVKDIRSALMAGQSSVEAELLRANGEKESLILNIAPLTDEERDIILAGCLINYYAGR